MIKTERLFLRELVPEDFEMLNQVLGDAELMKYCPCAFDEARARAWIAKNQKRYSIFEFGLWALCLKESGELIGNCGLTMQNIHGTICPQSGYHIRKDQQRQGHAKEVAGAVRD